MILQFKSEFSRIAVDLGCNFTTKSISEYEDFVQNYNFDAASINWLPIQSFASSIGASSQVIFEGECVLQFITKAVKSDNYEETKDILIDEMIDLSGSFFRELNKNENRVFGTPQFSMRNKVLRNYTSNYLAGCEAAITFQTSCANFK